MEQIHLASAESPGTSLINLKHRWDFFFFFFFFPFPVLFFLTAAISSSGLAPAPKVHWCALAFSGQKATIWVKTPQGKWEPPGNQPVTPGDAWGTWLGELPPANGCHRLGQQRSLSLQPGLCIYGLYLYTHTSLPRQEASEGLPKQLRDNCDDK